MILKTGNALKICTSRGGKATAGRLTKVWSDDGGLFEELADKAIASRLGILEPDAGLRITKVRRMASRKGMKIDWRLLDGARAAA